MNVSLVIGSPYCREVHVQLKTPFVVSNVKFALVASSKVRFCSECVYMITTTGVCIPHLGTIAYETKPRQLI